MYIIFHYVWRAHTALTANAANDSRPINLRLRTTRFVTFTRRECSSSCERAGISRSRWFICHLKRISRVSLPDGRGFLAMRARIIFSRVPVLLNSAWFNARHARECPFVRIPFISLATFSPRAIIPRWWIIERRLKPVTFCTLFRINPSCSFRPLCQLIGITF